MDLTIDDRRVHFTTGGREPDPALPLMLFVHGAGHDQTVWQLQTRYFAHHGYRVCALDLPGHGGSEGPSPDSITEFADWLELLTDRLDSEDLTLVGHSMGSLIALEFASRRAVTALCLLGPSPAMAVHPDLLAAAKADDHLAYELVTGWSVSRRSQVGGHATPGAWLSGGQLRLLERSQPGVLGSDLASCASYDRALDAARHVKAPTLLLVGERDLMTRPASVPPLTAGFANATTVTLPGVGHSMMSEAPDAVIDTIDRFLTDIH